jgi:hypothetical protein
MTLLTTWRSGPSRAALSDGMIRALAPAVFFLVNKGLFPAGFAARPQFTVNTVELVAVPPGVPTEIFPVTAPTGTVAVICV